MKLLRARKAYNGKELAFIDIAQEPLADTPDVKTRWIFHDPGRCECKSVPDVNEIRRSRLLVYDPLGKCNRSASTLKMGMREDRIDNSHHFYFNIFHNLSHH